ncbi:MAG: NADH-quinone oxidoreductase subunit M [Rubrobacteridae bacterium]|nr:NADH-quinone oxidoreductase subunit M [Rubrobacteridae bacterium]
MKYQLTLTIFIPLIGALLLQFIPRNKAGLIRWLALGITVVDFLLGLSVLKAFNPAIKTMQMVEHMSWMPQWGINYQLGLDGLSMPLFVLTLMLSVIGVLASWSITDRISGHYSMLLLLEVGMLGTFAALDFVLFYIFWELVLIPMYFIIGIWGGEDRNYAAIKFFMYTLAGSVLMLVGILMLYFTSGVNTFDMLKLIEAGYNGAYATFIFVVLFFGFAVKVPVWPFHTWLPDAHVQAPTAGSVLLAGIMLKMGTYAFIRILVQMMPSQFEYFAPFIAILAIISIVYGAYAALAQQDLKKMVAYSSVSHMGYVILGIAALTPVALNGAVLQMINHGLITGLLFLLVGFIYERTHTRDIAKLGGLAVKIPILGGMFVFAALASLGLPMLSGFVGEILILLGSYSAFKIYTILAIFTLALTSFYLIRANQNAFFGVPQKWMEDFKDANLREMAGILPLVIMIVVMGVYPKPFIDYISPAVDTVIKIMQR